MGLYPSVNLVEQTKIQNEYFCMQMSQSDRIRLILAPNQIVQATQIQISKTWNIQDTHHSPGFVEFKLTGTPWQSKNESLKTKKFLCSLLERFYTHGWHLKTASDLQRSELDTSVLFFHKESQLNTKIVCLSLDSSDLINVISQDERVNQIVKQSLINNWSFGIQKEKKLENCFEIKLKGNPWTALDGNDSFDVANMISGLMSMLLKNGWIFISGIDTDKYEPSPNSLYFRYAPDEINLKDLENTKFFAMTLNKTDRIRFHKPTNELISELTNPSYGMSSLWSAGIQTEKMVNNAFEFKLKGNPWLSQGQEAVESRRLINNLFNLLARYGWNLYASCVLTKNEHNKSTFIFRSKGIEPKHLENFCLSLNASDKIRLIEGDEEIGNKIRLSIVQGWPQGIQDEAKYYDSYQFKLNGYPFSSHSSDHIYACVMMTLILYNLEKKGFRLLCSADVSGKCEPESGNTPGHPIDLHSWFFENV